MASLQQGKAQAISRVSTQSNVRNAVIDRSALRQDGSSAPGCTTTFDASPQALIIFCSRVVWSLACMLRSCKRSVQPVSGPSVWIPHGCELELLNAGLRSPLQRHKKPYLVGSGSLIPSAPPAVASLVATSHSLSCSFLKIHFGAKYLPQRSKVRKHIHLA